MSIRFLGALPCRRSRPSPMTIKSEVIAENERELVLFVEENLQFIVLGVVILSCLIFDLGFFHRVDHRVQWKEALLLSVFWIFLSLCFNAWIFYAFGFEKGFSFFTSYLVEKSLSIDNIFVFVMIFSTFRVPPLYQYRVLFFGVLGAIVMRGLMIYFGLHLIEKFEWILLFFGGFLIFTGIKILISPEKKKALDRHPVLRFMRRFLPITSTYHRQNFWIRERGILHITPLFAALIMVEISDILFAVDSIPAVFAITRDPFIVYSSNIFAILGLRSLYFMIGHLIGKLAYLKTGISFILCFVGSKMLLADMYKVPTWVSLLVITLILCLTIGLSLLKLPTPPQKKRA